MRGLGIDLCEVERIERALKRVEAIVQGDPLNPATMIGAQASSEQLEKILSYLDIGRQEGAEVLTGGGPLRSLCRGSIIYAKHTHTRAGKRCQQLCLIKILLSVCCDAQ